MERKLRYKKLFDERYLVIVPAVDGNVNFYCDEKHLQLKHYTSLLMWMADNDFYQCCGSNNFRNSRLNCKIRLSFEYGVIQFVSSMAGTECFIEEPLAKWFNETMTDSKCFDVFFKKLYEVSAKSLKLAYESYL